MLIIHKIFKSERKSVKTFTYIIIIIIINADLLYLQATPATGFMREKNLKIQTVFLIVRCNVQNSTSRYRKIISHTTSSLTYKECCVFQSRAAFSRTITFRPL